MKINITNLKQGQMDLVDDTILKVFKNIFTCVFMLNLAQVMLSKGSRRALWG